MAGWMLAGWLAGWLACGSAAPPPPGTAAMTHQVASEEVSSLREAVRTVDDATAWGALAVALWHEHRASQDPATRAAAQDAVDASLAREPGHLPAVQLQVRIALAEDRLEEAAAASAQWLLRYPDDVTLLLLSSDALLALGQYQGALTSAQRALDLRPELRTYLRGAHLRWVFGDLDGAIELVRRAIRSGGAALPEPTAFCFVDLATLQLRKGDPVAAEQAALTALSLVPDYRSARSALGEALVAQARWSKALTVLRPLAHEHPRVEDLVRLARVLEEVGQPDEARRRLAEAEARAEQEPGQWARYLARRGESTTRALALAEVAAHRPTIEHLDTLALALLRAGRVADASAASERALAWGTPDASLHVHAALIAVARGDASKATHHVERARALDPHVEPELMREIGTALVED